MKNLFLTLFLMFLAVGNVMAQKAVTVKSFTQTTDHISGGDRRKDLNGNLCALVKVQVVDNIERVEGNRIGNIVKHGVENWVYMCKGSRNMRIHLQNHLPVKVVFQDYHINGLESNRVYELVLEIPDAPAPEQFIATSNSSAQQKFTLNYTPEHAMVLIDSKPYRGNGHIEMQLPVGEHSYIIAAEGYITAESTVKLTEHAPRVITEVLAIDNSAVSVAQSNGNQPPKNAKAAKKQKKKETVTPKTKKSGKTIVGGAIANAAPKDKSKKKKQDANIQKPTSTPKSVAKAKALNKSFSYISNGVTFKCKVKNGSATINGFDVKATDVVIPSQVSYNNTSYPVTTIDTHINGNNYSAQRLVIPDGVEVIEKYAFSEFRKLESVTIPSSVVKIGKNAFRNIPGMIFNIPAGINESSLRSGKEILTR